MSTNNGLTTFLLEQKTRFLADNGDGWTIVMGNDAGDLDSLASSIGFAWLLSQMPTSNSKAIALITTAREDFELRPENLYALQLVGIKEDFVEVLCPEDLPKPNACTHFALVDHNVLLPTYAAIPGARVTAIIDHHEDEGKHLDASPRVIEPSGSCASLVTRAIMSYPTLQIPPELAGLLLSAIVIDTHGLKKGGKAVEVDYQSSAWLLRRANVPSSGGLTAQTVGPPQDSSWIRSLSDSLSAKKTSLSQFSSRDLLRRDYKEYVFNLSPSIRGDTPRSVKGGLATVPLPLTSFFSPSPTSVVDVTREWIQERGLSILGVLTHYKSKRGKSKRELMWVIDENVCGPKLPQAVFDEFEGSEDLQVKRTKFERYGFGGGVVEGSADEEESVGEVSETSPFGKGLAARVYRQKVPTATRKQIAPVLKRALEG